MSRPIKPRSVEGVPTPALYMPSGWTRDKTCAAELAIEDFEVMRLVDGHAQTVVEAARNVGVSRSTAGRMLERARRVLALAIERREPYYIDTVESSVLDLPKAVERLSGLAEFEGASVAVALKNDKEPYELDRLFGRAANFALIDFSGAMRVVQNPGSLLMRKSAKAAVAFLAKSGVKRIIAGRFGPEALEELGANEIIPHIMTGVGLREAVEVLGINLK